MNREKIERLINIRCNEQRMRYLNAPPGNIGEVDRDSASARIAELNSLLRDIDRNSECLCRVCGENSGHIGPDSVCDQCAADDRCEFQDSDDSYGSRPGERGYND